MTYRVVEQLRKNWTVTRMVTENKTEAENFLAYMKSCFRTGWIVKE